MSGWRGRVGRWRVIVLALALGGLILAGGGYAGYRALAPREPDEGPSPAPLGADEVPQPADMSRPGFDPAVATAVEQARTAVRQAPHDGPSWGRLGMVLLAHEYRADATVCFARAERLDPREPRWPYYHALALAWEDSGDTLPLLERAAELFGDAVAVARLRLAEGLLEQGRLDEADGQFRRVLRGEARNVRARVGLARVAHARGDMAGSLEHLQGVAAEVRERKSAQTLLAEVHERLGHRYDAEQALLRAATLPGDPPWPDPLADAVAQLQTGRQGRLVRAMRLLDQGQVTKAVEALRVLVDDYPDAPYAWLTLGKALLQQGEAESAERALRKTVALAPDSVEGQFLLGSALLRRGGRDQALACFRTAIELKPDCGQAHYMVGRCLHEGGDRVGAIRSLRTAVRCKPQFAEAHRGLGELLLQEGLYGEAVEHLHQAVQLNPADERARQLLKQVQPSAGLKVP